MKPILIIDPGHGGKDPGGGSCDLFKEKDMVLQISLYQHQRCKELGIPATMTRDKDVYLAPEERAKIVRQSGAKYCLSNHINAGGGEGAETIYSIHSDGKLAHKILDTLVAVGAKKRRVFFRESEKNSGQDYYFMHRLTGSVETVIIEYDFADHPAGKKRVYEHWSEFAEAVLKAFCDHVGHPYKPPSEKKNDTEVSSSSQIPLFVNGQKIGAGRLIENTTFVPVRLIAEALGATVRWDGKTRSVYIERR